MEDSSVDFNPVKKVGSEDFVPVNKVGKRASGPFPFLNRAIATTVGAPADAMAWAIKKTTGLSVRGGRKPIEEDMEAIGARLPAEGQVPETAGEHIGQAVGEVVSMYPLGFGVAGLLSKGSGLAGSVAKNIMAGMTKHPYMSLITELSGGVGMGGGRAAADEMGIKSPIGRAALEIGGGMLGSLAPNVAVLAPSALLLRHGKTLLSKISMPFSKAGSFYRAGEFIKSKVSVPGQAAKEIAQPSIGSLPPVVQSGEKRLVALYKGLAGLDPVVDAESVEKMSRSIVTLESEMRKFGYGSPEVLADVTKKRVAAIELGMDKRISRAMSNAQQALDKLPVAQRPTQESVIVRAELDKLADAEYAKVEAMWGNVKKDTRVGTDNARKAYASILDDLSSAEKVDVPAELNRNPITAKKGSSAPSNVREMQGLRAKMLEVARIARKEGKWNKARIAGDVADAILVDFEAAAAANAPDIVELKAALAATRHYKTRFESGIVGDIRGWGKDGAPSIDPTLTLKKSIGRMGIEGAVDLDKVVVTPEARAATERYLGRAFTDYALDPGGTVSPVKAGRFVRNNEAILDQFPALRDQMLNTAKSQELATKTRALMDARKAKLRDPSASSAARLLNAANLDREIESVFKAPNRLSMAGQIVRQASKDKAGVALAGLRSGIVDHMLEKAHVGTYNELGEKTLSGRALLGFMNDEKNMAVLREVFEPAQIERMRKIGRELAKVEIFNIVPAGKADIEMTDFASSALRMFARVTGARVGGKLGASSAGGSLQMAQIFSGRAKAFTQWLTKNRAEQLVHDAVISRDPKLLQALLAPINKPGTKAFDKSMRSLDEQLNLWLAASGQRVWEDILDEENKGGSAP